MLSEYFNFQETFAFWKQFVYWSGAFCNDYMSICAPLLCDTFFNPEEKGEDLFLIDDIYNKGLKTLFQHVIVKSRHIHLWLRAQMKQ